jgi:UDP-galactopyranose mutase
MILGFLPAMHELGGTSCHDLICLSHLRWNFVFQRPQHLLTRCAKERRVFFFEEPVSCEGGKPRLELQQTDGVTVAVPHLPQGGNQTASLRLLVDELIASRRIHKYVLWYYTPMALSFTEHLAPDAVVYDCMDELSGFVGAPAELRALETELLRRADVVFTGGQSLYEAKRHTHANIHAFPSSVDVEHFAQARQIDCDPDDQARLPRPRLGFFGVIDERMDLDLLAGIAEARPSWQLVMLGPVVKIDPARLPRRANIHYLGPKTYQQLPHYIAGWDVALLPFARNEATRYISPTKTPEYLAAGKPVVSTSIRDVIRPYAHKGLARIADSVEGFVDACEAALADDSLARLRDADVFLRQTSWDGTWTQMRRLVDAVLVDAAAAADAEPARIAGAI